MTNDSATGVVDVNYIELINIQITGKVPCREFNGKMLCKSL